MNGLQTHIEECIQYRMDSKTTKLFKPKTRQQYKKGR